MPNLDEGSFLFMPTTMPHASIGEVMDVISKQDMAINAIPFLADRRLVFLAKPTARYPKVKGRKEFFQFLENVPPSTVLVLHEVVDDKKAENHWLAKWAKNSKIAQAEAFLLPKACKIISILTAG